MEPRQMLDLFVASGFVSEHDIGHPDGPDYLLTIDGFNAFAMLEKFIDRGEFDDGLKAALTAPDSDA